MKIKVVSHAEVLKMKANNEYWENKLASTPLPTLTLDIIRQKTFSGSALQLTNWAYNLYKQRDRERQKAEENEDRKKEHKRVVAKRDDELEL